MEPYIGSQIPIGKDRFFIELKRSETPKILKFEHLEDYKLPEEYNHYYLY